MHEAYSNLLRHSQRDSLGQRSLSSPLSKGPLPSPTLQGICLFESALLRRRQARRCSPRHEPLSYENGPTRFHCRHQTKLCIAALVAVLESRVDTPENPNLYWQSRHVRASGYEYQITIVRQW